MADPNLVYFVAFNLINVGITILFAFLFWQRDRSPYSPGVVMSVIMFYLYNSHFLVQGYNHQVYIRISMAQIIDMQIWIAATISLALFSCYAFTRPAPTVRRDFGSEQVFVVLLLLGAVIFAVNMIWRFDRVDWSGERFVTALLLSRASEEWVQQGNVNTGSPVDSLIRIMFLFCGYAFAAAALSRRLPVNLLAHLLFAAALVLFFFSGSRTSFIAPVFAYLLMRFIRSRNKMLAAALIAPVCVAVLYGSSFVLGFRTVGFERMDEFGGGNLSWQMDDNYPRLIYAAWHSWQETQHIDAAPLILLSFLNFVPRALWPAKPELPSEYFYPFKDANYVTISALGELNAIMHPIAASGIFIVMVYGLTRLAYRIYRHPDIGSFALYITYLLYAYAILRSLFNISAAIYIPALMLLVQRVTATRTTAQRREPERTEAQAPRL